MKQPWILVLWILFGFGILSLGFLEPARAQALNTGLEFAQGTGLASGDIRIIIANIIRVALGLLGIVTVGIILYAGFLFMTGGGNDEQIQKAKDWLRNGVIGLVIIIASFAIVSFVIGRLLEGVTGVPGGFGGGGVPAGEPFSSALGRGILQSHYPERGARGVPRNTMISVTFKEAIKLESVITDGKINPATIKIIRQADVPREGLLAADPRNFVVEVDASATPDQTTFVFRPRAPLGSPSENQGYVVALIGGREGILKQDGAAAFPGSGLGAPGYQWDFEVSTTLDLTPPQITYILPARRDDPYPRNVMTEIWFNEAVNPIAVAGISPEFQNLRMESSVDPRRVPGEFRVTNQYRTVEFTPLESCGVNSCGVNMYCLPANAAVTVEARSASLTPAADDGAQAALPFDGVTDMAGNSLDGDRDAQAEGPPVDSYSSAFATSGEVDRTAPALESATPNAEEGGVALDAPVTATFTKLMRTGTLTSENMSFAIQPEYEAGYTIRSEHLDRDGGIAMENPPVKTRATWMHGVLRPTTPQAQYYYFPGITSGAQDQFQNCFYPGIGPGVGGAGQCLATPDQPYCCNGEPSASRCAEPYLPAE